MPKQSIHRGFGRHLPLIQTICDFILLNAILLVLVFWVLPEPSMIGKRRFVFLLANVALIAVSSYFMRVHANRTIHTERLMASCIKGILMQQMLFVALMCLFLPNVGSSHFFGIDLAACVISFPLMWIVSYQIIKQYRRSGGNSRKVVIVGTGDTALRVQRNLMREAGFGVHILGFFGPEQHSVPDEQYKGSIDLLGSFVKKNKIEDIYCAGSTVTEDDIKRTIKITDDNFCQFYYVPPLNHHIKRDFALTAVNGSLPALTMHSPQIQQLGNRMLKRAFDILFSACVLGTAPLLLPPIAIAIKLSSKGPIFFTQERTGYRGKSFKCYKFRTMKVNSESDSRQATKDDDRKTRLGNFLRHTSIDELPQFWNVFKGNMSVVGPRPHMLAHTEEYRRLIDQYMVRHIVKPGITGWAQITGSRGATDELWQMEERVDKDVWYIEHWSFMLDLKIIIRTLTNAAKGEENAY